MFIVFVGYLGTSLLVRTADTPGATIFPEPLSPFTVRAFAAFFLALVLAALSLLPARGLLPYTELARVGLFLVLAIIAAALFNLDRFDFQAKPGGLLYIGAYAFTGLLAAFSMWWFRDRRRSSA